MAPTKKKPKPARVEVLIGAAWQQGSVISHSAEAFVVRLPGGAVVRVAPDAVRLIDRREKP